jgi:hypothetical protein
MVSVLAETGSAGGPCRASRASGVVRLNLCIGGITLGLNAASIDDLALSPEMQAFRLPSDEHSASCDIEIEVERVASLQPATGRKLFDSHGVWTAHENGSEIAFDFSTPVFASNPYKRLCVDRSFSGASLKLNRECYPGGVVDPLEYPTDELLIVHRLALAGGVEFHGCGLVDSECGGQLFLGHSGAGKSTTTRLWKSLRDVRVLSDDRIIVRHGSGLAELQPEGWLRSEGSREGNSPRIWMYGTPWHGEAAFALPDRAELRRIFILSHGAENRIRPLSKARAVAEMFSRCFVPFYSGEHLEATLACLNQIADALPCYRFEFIPATSAVETICNFHD